MKTIVQGTILKLNTCKSSVIDMITSELLKKNVPKIIKPLTYSNPEFYIGNLPKNK